MEVQLDFYVGEDVQTKFATNLTVQCNEHDTVIAFYEAKPPLMLHGSPEEKLAQLKEMKTVRAECVARVAIATNRLGEFIDAFKSALEKQQKSKELQATLKQFGNGAKE